MDIEETALPGIGLRHEFQTRSGRRIGVVSHHKGRRELVIYDAHDPDSVAESLALTAEESDALSELLGAPHIVEKLADLSAAFAGLVGERIRITPDSPYANRLLGDTQARTRTGASIVAVVRDQEVLASPRPDFRFHPDDVVVVVGTPENTAAVADLFSTG
ncbi:cation:proton antiporter regulatory subunit [Frankia sp. CNm7]|uniref:Cation:proton antiporter regulatory subunit n=1 Tax=Frankia nepalensis TaxID=1836974 RepID=A0A937RDL0_9ACTN|nr:cation:proton antiporter regulatory subunit [Frankia nepalensis]MBL7496415.1 cation:proton antiporter regulatory subunit [Frankia nepalensis]MBL7513785.1 cation:proton antiporter regulatory subunit [Frankia nepalensis]MBL7524685.1 cation:proton antiporter regulatory subunit [Frankia nepalensis]MBL7630201.1 cation:proton antiporter regulatory subunit [Frankia nepalensis]